MGILLSESFLVLGDLWWWGRCEKRRERVGRFGLKQQWSMAARSPTSGAPVVMGDGGGGCQWWAKEWPTGHAKREWRLGQWGKREIKKIYGASDLMDSGHTPIHLHH